MDGWINRWMDGMRNYRKKCDAGIRKRRWRHSSSTVRDCGPRRPSKHRIRPKLHPHTHTHTHTHTRRPNQRINHGIKTKMSSSSCYDLI